MFYVIHIKYGRVIFVCQVHICLDPIVFEIL